MHEGKSPDILKESVIAKQNNLALQSFYWKTSPFLSSFLIMELVPLRRTYLANNEIENQLVVW